MTTIAPPFEFVCHAGSLPARKAAVDHGADCIYLGFRDATNARNLAGLIFSKRPPPMASATPMRTAARSSSR